MLGDEEDFKPIKRARIPKNLSDSPLSHHTEEEGVPKRPLEKEGNNHQDLGCNGCCRLGLQLETFGNKEDEIFEKDYNFISCHLGPCLVENGQHLTVHFQPIVMNGIDQVSYYRPYFIINIILLITQVILLIKYLEIYNYISSLFSL